MPHKHLLFRSEAREKVVRGAAAIAGAVRVTRGPLAVRADRTKVGPATRLQRWGHHRQRVCAEGFRREPRRPDASRCDRAGDAVGDGTTTSTLLAHAIVAEGVRNIAAGASAIDLKRGLDRATRVAIEALRGQSRCVQSTREKQQVATISAHNDPAIGELPEWCC